MINIVISDNGAGMNLDIDCLRSFLVVADTMSFSRAAESVKYAI